MPIKHINADILPANSLLPTVDDGATPVDGSLIRAGLRQIVHSGGEDIIKRGVVWFVAGVIGISYYAVEDYETHNIKEIKVCFRFLYDDLVCQRITTDKLCVYLNASIYFAKAKIEVCLKDSCLIWNGSACYYSLTNPNPANKWICVKGDGTVVCFSDEQVENFLECSTCKL